MNKEKLLKMTKYVDSVKSKLSDTVIPLKHKNREKEYKEFLQRELKKSENKLEYIKLMIQENKWR